MIELNNITRAYTMGEEVVHALDGVNLRIDTGEFVAIIGPSGSGKSTLMNILGCLDKPTGGDYHLNGQRVSKLNDKQLARVRNRNIGFVFQQFNLLGKMSALRNVELPARYGGVGGRERRRRAVDAMQAVGLGNRLHHKPSELSGGQQQRVAVARAMVNQPTIILADEPTGALDQKTGREILDLFEKLQREHNITVILVTHDPSIAHRAHRVISIRDGRIESDIRTQRAAAVAAAAIPVAEAVAAGGEAAGPSAPALQPVETPPATPIPAEARGNGHGEDAAAVYGAAQAQASGAPVGAAPSAAHSTPPDGKPRKAPQTVDRRRIARAGFLAFMAAAILNVAISLIGSSVLGLSRVALVSPAPTVIATLIGATGATIVFAIVSRVSKRPLPVFRLVALGALLVSFAPAVYILATPLPAGGQFRAGQAGAGGAGQTATQGRTQAGGAAGAARGVPGVPGAGNFAQMFGGQSGFSPMVLLGPAMFNATARTSTIALIVLMDIVTGLVCVLVLTTVTVRKVRNSDEHL